MRLFRLTSRNQDTAFFDATFNDQVEIAPFSQIALQSASVKVINNEIIINESNNNLEFQIRDDLKRNFTLTPNQVYNTNFDVLYADITYNANGACKREATDPTNKILGIEWNVARNNESKTIIGYKIGSPSSYKNDWKTNQLIITGTVQDVIFTNLLPLYSASNNSNCRIPRSIARGNGYFRASRQGLSDDGSGNPLQNGIIVALTNNLDAPQTGINNGDITFGIHATFDATGNAKFYTIQDGVFTINNTISPQFSLDSTKDPNNSIMEITINGSVVELNIYNNNTATPTTILSVPYGSRSNPLIRLAPMVIFRGGNTGASNNNRLDNVRLTPSPYDIETTLATELNTVELGAPPKGKGGRNSDQNQLNFGSFFVAQYLGYDNQQIPLNDFILGKTADFVAPRQVQDLQNADSMLVQLLNLSVDSFDSFSDTPFVSGGQRKNILAVIPSTNSTGSIAYEPNERFFLDLNNQSPLTLRNIRARIVNTDYNEIPTNGISSLVLLIREKNNV